MAVKIWLLFLFLVFLTAQAGFIRAVLLGDDVVVNLVTGLHEHQRKFARLLVGQEQVSIAEVRALRTLTEHIDQLQVSHLDDLVGLWQLPARRLDPFSKPSQVHTGLTPLGPQTFIA